MGVLDLLRIFVIRQLSVGCPWTARRVSMGCPQIRLLMESSWRFFQQTVRVLSVDCLWDACGLSLVCPRADRGLSASCLWAVGGISVGYPRAFRGLSTGLWTVGRLSMDCPAAVRQLPVACSSSVHDCPRTVCPWTVRRYFFTWKSHDDSSNGLSVGCSWIIRGLSMGCPLALW